MRRRRGGTVRTSIEPRRRRRRYRARRPVSGNNRIDAERVSFRFHYGAGLHRVLDLVRPTDPLILSADRNHSRSHGVAFSYAALIATNDRVELTPNLIDAKWFMGDGAGRDRTGRAVEPVAGGRASERAGWGRVQRRVRDRPLAQPITMGNTEGGAIDDADRPATY